MSEAAGLNRLAGLDLPEAAVAAELQYHPAASLEESRDKAVLALTVRDLLARRAIELGMLDAGSSDEASVVTAIEDMLEAEIAVPPPSEADCEAWYGANSERLRSPDLFDASHILFAADPADPEARTAARDAAVAAIAEITAVPARFEAIAKERSACPSGASGGNLGQIVRGSTVPEFETYLFSLEEGEMCPEPVASRYGYHVIKLHRRAEGRVLPYGSVRARVARAVEELAWRAAFAAHLRKLASRYGAGRA
jgi:peptidyl-prolyl cis-trans isomerase C